MGKLPELGILANVEGNYQGESRLSQQISTRYHIDNSKIYLEARYMYLLRTKEQAINRI